MGQGFPAQRLGVNISAGTGLALTGTIVLSNSNGVSFGMQLSASSNVITASVNAGFALSAGTTIISSGTGVFSNSNGISFGINGQTLTADYGILAAATTVTGPAGVAITGSNGITVSATNNATITVAHTSVRFFDSPGERNNAIAMAPSSSAINISVQRFSVPYPIIATELDVVRHLTVVGSTAGSYSFSIGIYTMSGSTASQATSFLFATSWSSGTSTSAASTNYGGQSGTRLRFITGQTWSFTPGEYLLAFGGTMAGVAGTTGSISLFGRSSISIVGPINTTGNQSRYFGDGVFSVGSGNIPGSFHLSDIVQTGASALGQPYFRFIGTF